MDNGILGLIGLARKAGKVEVGEEAVSIAARNHKARAIFFASDAAENTLRRRESLGNQGNCPSLILPVNKTELGGGRRTEHLCPAGSHRCGAGGGSAEKAPRRGVRRHGGQAGAAGRKNLPAPEGSTG